ncbi:hypothetical protein [Paenibacillus kandeliae]|uniref:hypothetical protein n=1 Tax=Paenibacillus kandeliae TaxID=3231269 RepID=UPI00345997D2
MNTLEKKWIFFSDLSDDLKELARTEIRIDGVEVPMSKRTLDIRVPQGYADSIDLKGLLQKAGKITVKVEEF